MNFNTLVGAQCNFWWNFWRQFSTWWDQSFNLWEAGL
jgi:hypothetical protein